MTPAPLSPALYAILAALVEEHSGMHYAQDDFDIFSSKVAACALESGFESPLDYYYAIRYDDPNKRTLDALCDALVVNETYFFREADQLRALCDRFLAPLVSRGERPRVWCAAAATGEEPLSLAMLLEERGIRDMVEIVASDISQKALMRATVGFYGPRSFRAGLTPSLDRWFRRVDDRLVVDDALRTSIKWKRVNILDADAVATLGTFDAVLCRNVLIYFSEATVRRVVSILSRALHPSGHLLVGASESLLRFGTELRCEEHGGSFFYAKAA